MTSENDLATKSPLEDFGMNFKMFLAFIFGLFPLSVGAECPLGAKETHLTVQRVMRNFGRYISDADHLCVKGQNPSEKVTDAEITLATANLGLAIACANEVLKNPTGDVLPSKLELMTDEKEKAELIDDYVYFMTDFRDELVLYRSMFQNVLAQPASERDFQEVNEKRQDVDQLVNRAHKKL